VSGQNFGEREGGGRTWITGGEGLSTVCIAARAGGPLFCSLTPVFRGYQSGICVEESASG
jgi:hypothetical protein